MSPVTQYVFDGTTWQNEVTSSRSSVGRAGTTTEQSIYRPIHVTSLADLRAKIAIPSDANLVMWPYSDPRAADLDTVFKSLGANDILVLPEASTSYLVDSSHGFVKDARRWMEMARVKRGLVGMGPGTLVEIGPSSFSQPKQTKSSGGVGERVFGCSTVNAIYANFEMRGRDLGGVAYHALCHNKSDSIFQRIYANAAHRGFRNSPGGEAGALGSNGVRPKVLNCEVECRGPDGRTRVASSPIMFNNSGDVTMTDVYAHHANAGMITCYRTSGGTFTRVRSEFNGSGSSGGSASYEPAQGWGLGGSEFNFEDCQGTFVLDDCSFLVNYQQNYDSTQPVGAGAGNVGAHMGGGSYAHSVVFYIRRPKFDYGSDGANRTGGYRFDMQWQPTYAGQPQAQKSSDFHITDVNSAAIPFKIRS